MPLRLRADFLSGLAAGICVLAAAGLPHAGSRATPEALVHVMDLREPRISPDGTRVAFVAADSLDPTLFQIWLVDTNGGSRPLPFTAGGRSAHAPVWSPDGANLLFLSARSDTGSEQIQTIDVAGGESLPVTGEPGGVLAMACSPDGASIAYLTPGLPRPLTDPIDASLPPPGVRLRVRNAVTGETRTVSPDTASVWNFAWSPEGRRLAVTFTRPGRFGEWRQGRLALVQEDGSGWLPVRGRADPLQEPAFSPDGRQVAYYALPGSTQSYPVLHVYDVSQKSANRLSSPGWRGTDEGILWTKAAGLLVNAFEGVTCTITRVDPETGERTPLVERWVAAGKAGTSFSATSNGSLAFLSDGPDHPADVFFQEAPGRETIRLTRMHESLAALELPAVRRVTWPTFDGRSIEGLLITPADSIAAPWPLVVLPHAGPASAWTFSFYNDAHAPGLLLASEGYAVLYPNPRGSTGYGEEFKRLNERDLGGGDYRDLLAGVDSLIAAGVVDSTRIGIAGFSYGGYLSAWAAGNSNRFRCAVVGAAPMDFRADHASNELSPWWQEEFLGGDPLTDPEAYRARSAISHVGKIRCPVLIIHGSEDRRVPLFHSRELFEALRDRGVPAEFYIYPGEGHGFTQPIHRIDLARRQVAWMKRYLK